MNRSPRRSPRRCNALIGVTCNNAEFGVVIVNAIKDDTRALVLWG
jgi:hypothetical protein